MINEYAFSLNPLKLEFLKLNKTEKMILSSLNDISRAHSGSTVRLDTD